MFMALRGKQRQAHTSLLYASDTRLGFGGRGGVAYPSDKGVLITTFMLCNSFQKAKSLICLNTQCRITFIMELSSPCSCE